jgi:hypothetical protein
MQQLLHKGVGVVSMLRWNYDQNLHDDCDPRAKIKLIEYIRNRDGRKLVIWPEPFKVDIGRIAIAGEPSICVSKLVLIEKPTPHTVREKFLLSAMYEVEIKLGWLSGPFPWEEWDTVHFLGRKNHFSLEAIEYNIPFFMYIFNKDLSHCVWATGETFMRYNTTSQPARNHYTDRRCWDDFFDIRREDVHEEKVDL